MKVHKKRYLVSSEYRIFFIQSVKIKSESSAGEMASSTCTMEVDKSGKKAEEDDISSKAKKYVAEKRKLARGGGGQWWERRFSFCAH